MIRILLACSAGMSTSLLVKRMEKYANEIGLDCEIEAMSISQAKKEVNHYDICLIGPQIRDQFHAVKRLTDKPVMVIDTRAYGLINGEAVLKSALDLLNQR